MEIKSKIYDKRIESQNYMIELEIGEYIGIAKKVLDKNEYQRKKVKKSNTVYSLLKDDLKTGCVIPPLVLALSKNIDNNGDEEQYENIIIKNVEQAEDLLILDGLQRTYSILDIEKELSEKGSKDLLEKFKSHKMRIEIYTTLDKIGILYRMLTLNTGQTPMSIRHQIEILYSNYRESGIEDIKFIREVDEIAPSQIGEYKFKDIIEGFNSYIERSEFPIDRADILENIESLKKLSKENQKKDLFIDYVKTYNKFVKKLYDLTDHWEFSGEDSDISGQPFGRNVLKIFQKPQVMSGFGAAIGKMIDFKIVDNFKTIDQIVDDIQLGDEADTVMNNMILKLEKIKQEAKKIGNAQRTFFQYFFRQLFNQDSDSYMNINISIDEAYRKYISQI